MYLADAIGIDLGTTSVMVAIMQSGQVEILPNSDGENITENYVAFSETDLVVGEVAKNEIFDIKNVIFGIKKFLGRTWEDPVLQKHLHHLPYDIINDNGRPKIKVEYKREICLYSPEEIISFVLSKLKTSTEIRTNKLIRKAVITIPTHFKEEQRKAVKKAAAIAGFKVLDLLLEPIAAIMAYKLDNCKEKKVFVLDFGGARVSASVVSITDGKPEIIATDTNIYVGGEDFDDRLFVELLKIFRKKHNVDMTECKIARRRLRDECRRVKHILSAQTYEMVQIDSIYQNIDFYHDVTRAYFEYINRDLFNNILHIMQKVIQNSKLNESDIDHVVLAGGAVRMPKVQKFLRDIFKNQEFHDYISPEQVMVEGAARHAGALDQFEYRNDNPPFVNATTESLGIETSGGIMDILIPRLTVPPVKVSKMYTTYEDDQPGITVRIFRGERALTSKNCLLAKMEFWLPNAPKGIPQVKITFKIDRDYILTVTVEEILISVKESIKIERFGIDLFVEEERLQRLDENKNIDTELRKEVTNTIEYISPKKVGSSLKVVNLG